MLAMGRCERERKRQTFSMFAVNKIAIAACSRPGCQHNLGRAPAQGDAERMRKCRPVQEDDPANMGLLICVRASVPTKLELL